jgi:hypothetical protein
MGFSVGQRFGDRSVIGRGRPWVASGSPQWLEILGNFARMAGTERIIATSSRQPHQQDDATKQQRARQQPQPILVSTAAHALGCGTTWSKRCH